MQGKQNYASSKDIKKFTGVIYKMQYVIPIFSEELHDKFMVISDDASEMVQLTIINKPTEQSKLQDGLKLRTESVLGSLKISDLKRLGKSL
jgi:hypothetical protein